MRPHCNSGLIRVRAPHEIGPRWMRPNRARHVLAQGLLGALLAVAGAAPAAAAPLELPAIVEPATDEHHVGKVIFVELVTPDLAAAKQFYGGLFGWTFRDMETGGTAYAEALLDWPAGRGTGSQG